MSILTPLVALVASLSVQGSDATNYILDGRPTSVVWPDLKEAAPADDIRAWKGWTFLQGGTAPEFPSVFGYGLAKSDSEPTSPAAGTFRLKVIVSTLSGTRLDAGPDAHHFLYRGLLTGPTLAAEMNSVARACEWVRRTSGGVLAVKPETEIRRTMDLYEGKWEDARLNGPGFQSEDGVYRGPYDQVVKIDPQTNPDGLDYEVVRQIWSGLQSSARTNGVRFDATTPQPFTEGTVKALLAPEPAAKDAFDANHTNVLGALPVGALQLGYHSPNVTLSLADDPDRGKVLRYIERGALRSGGFALPKEASKPGKRLAFWMRSTARDGLILHAGTTSVSIGACALPTYLPFHNDGTWQRLVVDVPSDAPVIEILATSPDVDRDNEKHQLEPVLVDFDHFELVDDAPTPLLTPTANFSSDNALERILALEGYAKAPTAEGKPLALRLLNDPDDAVRCLACHVLETETEAQPQMLTNIYSLNGFVARAALKAVATENTELGWSAIRRATGPGTPMRRITAVQLMSTKNDPNFAGTFSGLIGDPNIDVQAAGAIALSTLHTDVSGAILAPFLEAADPYVSLTAVESAPIDLDPVVRKMLYVAVNAPWDRVRAAARLRLSTAETGNFRQEGWKGVNDDSPLTRALFIKGASPKAAEFPSALRIALQDRSASVRAAAIEAFLAAPESVRSTIDVSVTFNDFAPAVQEVLIRAAIAKAVTLPPAVSTALKAAFDPAVAAAAAQLP